MAEVLEYLCADFNRSALNYLGIMDKKDTTIEEKKTAEQQPVEEQPVKEQPAKEEPVKEQDKKEKKKKNRRKKNGSKRSYHLSRSYFKK